MGRPGHLQESAPLWDEIGISDVGLKIWIKNDDDENDQFKFPTVQLHVCILGCPKKTLLSRSVCAA